MALSMTTRGLVAFLIITAICSCETRSNHNSIENHKAVDTTISKIDTSSKQYAQHVLPNDEFRRVVRSYLRGKDLLILDTILTKLDKKGLTFCEFIHRLLDLDDSCYAAGNRKFPMASQQNELSKYASRAIAEAESRYVKSLNITQHSLDFAGSLYGFDDHTRAFCGKF